MRNFSRYAPAPPPPAASEFNFLDRPVTICGWSRPTGAALFIHAAAGEAAVDEPVTAQPLGDAEADRLDATSDVLLRAGTICGQQVRSEVRCRGVRGHGVTGHGHRGYK